jgi:energy-coupling factor transporter ATP-binding protein EcfA2
MSESPFPIPSSNNDSFRIIAIRPLKDCSPKYLKVLEEGEIYRLSSEYEFEKENQHGQVTKIIYNRGIPEGFFQMGNLDIQVSAIVGGNGSGKSTLVELLIVAVYLLSVQEGILENNRSRLIDELKELIPKREELNQDRLKLEDSERKQSPQEKRMISELGWGRFIAQESEAHADLRNSIKRIHAEIKSKEALYKGIEELWTAVKLEIYFLKGGFCYMLRIEAAEKDLTGACCHFSEVPLNEAAGKTDPSTPIPQNIAKGLGKTFFYSILLNYSHYAHNSRELGEWINDLFHKNDGYQTPMVINPMRTEGNIDINKENHLVRSRLLALLLRPVVPNQKWGENLEDALRKSPRNLIGDRIAYNMKLTLDHEKMDKLWEIKSPGKYWPTVIRVFAIKDHEAQSKHWYEQAKEYILAKLNSMAENYPPYGDYHELFGFTEERFEEYLNRVKEDPSHVTFKVKQAINYLLFEYATDYSKAENGKGLDSLASAIALEANSLDELILMVPPAFLKVDINFHPNESNWEDSLERLSSGEKQKVYSGSSIIYHLSYLDSVHRDNFDHKYTDISLIFDEIEMYYHPELQRTFVRDMLTAIQRAGLKVITGVNCLFITHSPFILSDIPISQVLLLKRGKTQNIAKDLTQTFAANIHTLLADAFFLQNGLIGEYAKRKIQGLLDLLNDLNQEFNDKERSQLQQLIELVGDPLLKKHLQQRWDDRFLDQQERLRRRRIVLTEEVARLDAAIEQKNTGVGK